MAWNAEPQGGFTDGKPWLPLHSDHEVRNVAVQRRDPDSLWNWYAKLLRLRKEIEVFRVGSWHDLHQDHPDVLAFRRTRHNESWLVLVNCGRRAAKAIIPGPGRWKAGTHERSELLHGSLELDGYEVAIVRCLLADGEASLD
jgi:glycosidase